MPKAYLLPTKISAGDFADVPVPGAPQNGQAMVWNQATQAMVWTAVEAAGASAASMASHLGASDPHSQYLNAASHLAAADPHASYLLASGGRIASSLSVNNANTNPNTGALYVERTFSGVANIPLMTAVFRNTVDSGGNNAHYQGDVHIRLWAGTNERQRRYINFARPDGTDDWLTGANAHSNWILYDDTSTAHRMWLNTIDDALGHTYINSVGTGSVVINAMHDGGAGMGTGGLKIGAGGTNTNWFFTIDGNGQFVSGTGAPIEKRYQGYIFGTFTQDAGGGIGGLFIQPTYNPSANSVNTVSGIYVNPRSNGSFNPNSMIGGQFIVSHLAAAPATSLTGAYFIAQNLVAQVVTTAFGIQVQIQNSNAAGEITTGNGVYVVTPTNAGVLTQYNGVRVLDATAVTFTAGIRSQIGAGTGKWNLYIDGGANNYIGAPVSFGHTAVPTALIDLTSGTATRAPIRFRAGSAPTTPNDGDVWYPSAGRLNIRRAAITEIFASGVQATGGAATAGASYTAAEQSMLQKVYDAARAFGLLT